MIPLVRSKGMVRCGKVWSGGRLWALLAAPAAIAGVGAWHPGVAGALRG